MKYKKSFKKARYTILSISTFLIFLLLQAPFESAYGQWEKCVIDNSLSQPEIVSVGDLNNDGKPDVVLGDIAQDKIFWYENNNPNWIKHTIEESLDGAYHVRVGDLNGDGMLDVAASGYDAKLLVWYENHDSVWTRHIIDSTQGNAGCVKIFDVDDDDTLDVVMAIYDNSNPERDFAWYENNHPTWTKHVISTDFAVGDFVFGDIDEDGMMDVATSRWIERQVVWFKNENGGLSWTKRFIDKNSDSGVLSLSDLNGDDKIDVVITTYTDNTVVWYENNDTTWIPHIIDENLTRSHSVVVLDIDADNKPDVVVTGKGTNEVLWYKNNHPVWEKYIIDPNLAGPHRIAYADIDGDGTLDIIVPGENAGNIVWYKNPYTKAAYATSVEVDPAYIQKPGDMLTINSKLANPENHTVDIIAIIHEDNSGLIDSLQLFDDGLHGDGNSADNMWGNMKLLSGLQEDIYNVKLVTQDLNFDTQVYYCRPVRFTTIGPVTLESYSFVSSEDTVLNPGDQIKMKLTLKNNGSTVTATNIIAKLTSLDAIVNVSSNTCIYGDIAAGDSSISNPYYGITIPENCPVDTQIPILVEIKSDDYLYWTDTLNIHVQGRNNLENIRNPVTRIYPNPTYDIIFVEVIVPVPPQIEVYSMSGKLIFAERMKSTTHQLDLSGLQKGVYFIAIRSKDTVTTRKIIKL